MTDWLYSLQARRAEYRRQNKIRQERLNDLFTPLYEAVKGTLNPRIEISFADYDSVYYDAHLNFPLILADGYIGQWHGVPIYVHGMP